MANPWTSKLGAYELAKEIVKRARTPSENVYTEVGNDSGRRLHQPQVGPGGPNSITSSQSSLHWGSAMILGHLMVEEYLRKINGTFTTRPVQA